MENRSNRHFFPPNFFPQENAPPQPQSLLHHTLTSIFFGLCHFTAKVIPLQVIFLKFTHILFVFAIGLELFFKLINFYWRTVALQCVSFYCTAK